MPYVVCGRKTLRWIHYKWVTMHTVQIFSITISSYCWVTDRYSNVAKLQTLQSPKVLGLINYCRLWHYSSKHCVRFDAIIMCILYNKLTVIEYSLRSNSNTTFINPISVGMWLLSMLLEILKSFISVNRPTSDGIGPVILLSPGEGNWYIEIRYPSTKSNAKSISS